MRKKKRNSTERKFREESYTNLIYKKLFLTSKEQENRIITEVDFLQTATAPREKSPFLNNNLFDDQEPVVHTS